MFDNMGRKLKALAPVLFVGIILVCIGVAVFVWTDPLTDASIENSAVLGFEILISGIVGAWLGSWIFYALGELVENSEIQLNQNNEILKLLKNGSCEAE